ncbi:MAG: HRDC domain-containing protein, partial [Myxococcales bacterium]|nr:HRDC domain-containing protein [Myxococcales bacterium]
MSERGAMDEHRWIDTGQALDALLDELEGEARYGLDTEFLRERTYHPELALVQIGWPGGVALIDPLAAPIERLARLFEGEGLAILHASSQDLEILRLRCGTVPRRLYDLQIAGAFTGLGIASLATLVRELLDAPLSKGARLTDWTRRPLDAAERAYAAADVEHLLALHDRLVARLEEAGRTAWALTEMRLLLEREPADPEPETAWWKLKGANRLNRRAGGVAQSLAAWRQREAEARDRPVRALLPDVALLSLAERPPEGSAQLRRVRGLDGRHLGGGRDAMILEAIRRGLALEDRELRRPALEPRGDKANVHGSVCLALASQVADELGIDPSFLATRKDITALIRGEPSRLDEGFRKDL